jgi:hypothetical protein
MLMRRFSVLLVAVIYCGLSLGCNGNPPQPTALTPAPTGKANQAPSPPPLPKPPK